MLQWHIFQYMGPEHLQPLLSLVLQAISDIQSAFEKEQVHFRNGLACGSEVHATVYTPACAPA